MIINLNKYYSPFDFRWFQNGDPFRSVARATNGVPMGLTAFQSALNIAFTASVSSRTFAIVCQDLEELPAQNVRKNSCGNELYYLFANVCYYSETKSHLNNMWRFLSFVFVFVSRQTWWRKEVSFKAYLCS